MHHSLLRTFCLAIAAFLFASPAGAQTPANHGMTKLRFEVSLPPEPNPKPIDGRVYLLLSTNDKAEPRFQINYSPETQQFFGVDVDGLTPGKPAIVDAAAVGYPAENPAAVPAGDYYVQGLLNVYETYHLANGYTVQLAPDRGEGQQWNRKPGNLYSKPVRFTLIPHRVARSSSHLPRKFLPSTNLRTQSTSSISRSRASC